MPARSVRLDRTPKRNRAKTGGICGDQFARFRCDNRHDVQPGRMFFFDTNGRTNPRFIIKYLILLAAGVVFASSVGMPSSVRAESCGIHTPGACRDTSLFVNAPGGDRAIEDFLKNEPGVTPKTKAFQDLERVLEGPPLDRIDLPNGLFLFGACQIHNCADKGALIVRRDGKIVAAGILHYVKFPAPILTIFARDAQDRPDIEPALTSWAQSQLDAEPTVVGEPKQQPVSAVEFKVVGSLR